MKRNERKWFEDGQVALLDKGGSEMQVVIEALHIEHQGEAVYLVREIANNARFPASEKNLKRMPSRGAR